MRISKFEMVLAVVAIMCFATGVLMIALDRKPYVPNIAYSGVNFDPGVKLETHQFNSVEELSQFVQENQGAEGMMYQTMGVRGAGVATDAAVSAPVAKEASGSLDYSETNVQVAGVDEADILKTDGDYIYTVTGNTLFIVKAYPGEEAEVVTTLDFDSQPQGIFVDGDYLAVFGDYYSLDFFEEMDIMPRYGMSFFNIYDISERDDPQLVEDYKFEGNYFNARMKEGIVYLVTRSGFEYRPGFPTPLIFEGNVKIAMPVSDMYYYNIPYQNPEWVNVHAIDLAKQEMSSKSVAVEGSQNMYMSPDNIYITYTEWVNEWELEQDIMIDLLEPKLLDSERALIAKIEQTDNEVLSKNEKQAKIWEIYSTHVNLMDNTQRQELQDKAEELLIKKLEEYEYREFTIIHKITVDGMDISVEGNGKVPGHVINQFAMDEFKSIFRVATTVSQSWSRFEKVNSQSTNNVFALDEDMQVIGSLKGLAEGEQIYSTRFMGYRLYMVTFRQVDPFFVIDLSDPENIEELGKLKIPGFSRYLHPYDEDTIIGIGQEASELGRVRGLKISLFDVSDVSKPKEIAKFVTEEQYAQSTALWEHKAFLFDKEKELLVIPAYSYEWDSSGRGSSGYNGAFVFRITKDEIELRGLIDHSMATGDQYGAMVERSLYIEELLYTKSPTLLRINELEDLSKVKNVELRAGTAGMKVY
ncbi:MAG: beta-propeller domain-containing protein [Candidatus Woesearchaeota archaeon]